MASDGKDKAFLYSCKAILLASATVPMSLSAQASTTDQPQTSATKTPPRQPDETGVQDIVVTAQRRAESLSRVPISISVARPEQLATAGVINSFDLPRVTPGLSVSAAGSGGIYFNPFIRGVGSGASSAGNDSSIAIYIDGVYQSDKGANVFDLNDIERVELLKGPQGTLFGRNATGGAINVITKMPSLDKLTGNVEGSYARFNEWQGRLYVTGPVSDNLALSLAYQHRGGGDFAQNIDPRYAAKFGGQTSNSVDGKFLWRPSERFELVGSLGYNTLINTDSLAALVPAPGTTPVGVLFGGTTTTKAYEYAGSPGVATVKSFRATLHAKYSFDGFDVVSVTGLVKDKGKQFLDYDATTADLYYFRGHSETRDVSEEAQVLSTGSGRFSWQGGFYYFDGLPRLTPLQIVQNAPYTGTNSDIVNSPGGVRTDIYARQPTTAAAVYGQATYDFGGGTKFTGGLRYTSEKRKYSFDIFGIGQIVAPTSTNPGFFSPDLIPLLSDHANKKTFRKLTWRFALEHQFSPETLGYVSYNRGFKSGVYNMNSFVPGTSPVNPEVLDSYEAGIKTKMFDNRLELNLAGFYYDYKNIQVTILTRDPTNPTQLQNAASQRMYGLDVDFIYHPSKGFTLRGSGTLLHSKYVKYPNAITYYPDALGNVVLTPIDASGDQGIYSPKWTFTVGADYDINVRKGSVVLSANYFRTARYHLTVISPIDFSAEQDNLGASVTYYSPNKTYYVRVFGENLTDQRDVGRRTDALATARSLIRPISYGVAAGLNF